MLTINPVVLVYEYNGYNTDAVLLRIYIFPAQGFYEFLRKLGICIVS